MSRINKFVLTVSLLIFIMISAVACGIYTQMVKERVYSLKQSVIDTAFAVANWICPYISRHLLSLNPLQARCRRYSRGERSND